MHPFGLFIFGAGRKVVAEPVTMTRFRKQCSCSRIDLTLDQFCRVLLIDPTKRGVCFSLWNVVETSCRGGEFRISVGHGAVTRLGNRNPRFQTKRYVLRCTNNGRLFEHECTAKFGG